MSGDPDELIARMRALVDLTPLEARYVATLSRHPRGSRYRARS
jgi:hypothetical protein